MKAIRKSVFASILAFHASTILTGCYPMPTENDFSLVPTTNNPAVTCERHDSPIPGLGY